MRCCRRSSKAEMTVIAALGDDVDPAGFIAAFRDREFPCCARPAGAARARPCDRLWKTLRRRRTPPRSTPRPARSRNVARASGRLSAALGIAVPKSASQRPGRREGDRGRTGIGGAQSAPRSRTSDAGGVVLHRRCGGLEPHGGAHGKVGPRARRHAGRGDGAARRRDDRRGEARSGWTGGAGRARRHLDRRRSMTCG